MKAWYEETLNSPLVCAERPDPAMRPGRVVDVLAVHLPAYLGAMADSTQIPLPVPLVLGAGGIDVVKQVADEVHGLAVDDIVVLDSLVQSADADRPQDVLMGPGEIGGRGHRTDVVNAMRTRWRDGTMAQRAALPKEAVTRLPGAGRDGDLGRLAFLTWPGIAAEGVEQSDQRPGDIVAVVGTLVLTSGTRCDVPLPYGEILRRRLTIRGSRMYRPQTVLSVWRMARSGSIDLGRVEITEAGIDDPKAAIKVASRSSGRSFVALVP